MGRIDEGLALTQNPDLIFTAFGDMMRVPGSKGSPLAYKAQGADIRIVYSPLDALELARRQPEKQVLFFAIGFETTSPSTALTLKRARALNINNFSVFCNHVLVVPAMQAVLEQPSSDIEAFIGPGHVSTVIGAQAYQGIARDYQKPVVVAGFEPLDLLQALLMIIRQLNEGRAEVENQYSRAVRWEGNPAALSVLNEVFEVRPSFAWRGLSEIPKSAQKLRPDYAAWDAEERFDVRQEDVAEVSGARCGQILVGAAQPNACALFGAVCNPEQPIGAPMVSSEGACAAYYHYVHRKTAAGVL
jgi:hydrogenase expression/formation protein HypD